jgi:hypothetical protein
VTYLLLFAAFYFLLFLVYFIPTNLMYDEVETSTETLSSQGLWYCLVGNDAGDMIDNFTIADMLNIAVHNDGDIWQRPLLGGSGGYSENNDQIAMLGSGYNQPVRNFYEYYWHGWLIIIKPLLTYFDLVQIQQLFLIAMFALAGYACFEISRWGKSYAVSLGFALFLVGFWRTAVSLPNSFAFYIALLGCIVVSQHERRSIASGDSPNLLWLGICFFVLGALTNYFDFLDTPPITLGLPLLVLLIARRPNLKDMRWRDLVLLVAATCVSWTLGYGLLFASKWILGTIVTGDHVLTDAINEFIYRSGTTTWAVEGGLSFSRADVIARNIDTLLPTWVYAPLAVLLIAYVVILRRKGMQGLSLQFMVCVLVVSAIPFAWFCIASNHSYVHYWFTYRDLIVTCFGIFLLLGGLIRLDDEGRPTVGKRYISPGE